MDEIIVTPSRSNVAETDLTRGASLTQGDLERVPQIGDDLFRSIGRLPGLAADDFTAKVWVRGAPNTEVLTRFDGVDLIDPYHLKDYDGAVSIVDLQTASSVEAITGGFTAEYGNRLAGVVNVVSRSAPPAAMSTRISLNLLNLSLSSSGVFASSRGQWFASFRKGLPDLALKSVHEDQTLSPRYHDFMGKLEYQVAPTHTVSLHLLHAADRLTVRQTGDPELRSSSSDTYFWIRWRGSFGDRLTKETVISLTNLERDRQGSGLLGRSPFFLRDRRDLKSYSARQDWQLSVSDSALLRFGFEGAFASNDYRYIMRREVGYIEGGAFLSRPDQFEVALAPDGSRAGSYAAVRWRPLPSLTFEPAVRFDRQDYTGESQTSPRLNAAWSVAGGTLRAAWGLYHQPQGLHELQVSDRDIGFHGAERAEHRVLSFERQLSPGLGLRVEVYERKSSRLRPRWLNLDDPYNAFPEVQSDRVRLTPSEGRARGLEFTLRGKTPFHLSWNASYALARSEEKMLEKWIPRARDQRHTLQLDATYAPNRRWQFSAAWQYHTGWPTSETSYRLLTLGDGSQVVVANTAAPFSLQLPAYHRLDLRVTRQFILRRGTLSAYLDLFNAYDRSNLIGYDREVMVRNSTVEVTTRPRKLFPFLPTAGLAWEF